MSYDDDEEDFDYEEFVEREFGTQVRSKNVPLHWQIVAMALVLLFVLSFWISLGLWTPF